MNKNLTKSVLFAVILFTIAIAGTGCLKGSNSTPGTIPVIITRDVIKDAIDTSAHSGGFISETLTNAVSTYGICWSATNATPTTSDSKTADTVSLLSFTSRMKGLKINTKYYVRAYAINSVGTGYGSVIEITTGGDLTSKVGTVSTLAGNANPDLIDGTGAAASFYSPQGITIDNTGTLIIADAFNSAIRKVTTGGAVTTLTGDGTIGYVDGSLADARFYAPQSLVTDATGNIYVADFSNNIIRKITPAGVVSTLAGSGSAGYDDGTGIAASFNNPRGLVFDATGNLYVSDRGNNLIRKVTPAGVVTTFAGSRASTYADQATATSAAFNRPSGIAIDAAGNLFVADALNYSVRKITSAGVVTTFLGDPTHKVIGSPSALTFDAKGNLFIVDQTGRVFEVTTDKTLLTLAGKSATAGYTEGSGSSALFASPQGVAADASGNIYVADAGNNSIRKIVLPTF
ncbi:NHL repeat-containing protein [Mucilaginibacter sp. FT3.2]|uniref:NHL repeat-containing protein n=1 Tax=Mucilaginibacter sp. FT3.2 TaxID=2723090 RepID=UPI0016112E92|nr:NHL repeat-containing protein [Mucilaginibacter sp. FT3.2]MBB6235170.1 secreted PhoX family phosphatase [Mucilaginibacter sp. FT3.2]